MLKSLYRACQGKVPFIEGKKSMASPVDSILRGKNWGEIKLLILGTDILYLGKNNKFYGGRIRRLGLLRKVPSFS